MRVSLIYFKVDSSVSKDTPTRLSVICVHPTSRCGLSDPSMMSGNGGRDLLEAALKKARLVRNRMQEERSLQEDRELMMPTPAMNPSPTHHYIPQTQVNKKLKM